MVREALLAAKILEKKKIDAAVVNMHTIKPIDERAIINASHETKAIVTVEEHQISGGLGSAVAEVVTQNRLVPVQRVGMRDEFGESGTADKLLNKYGLRAQNIADAAELALARTKQPKEEFKLSSRIVKKITTKKPMRKVRKKVVKKTTKKKAKKKTVKRKTKKKTVRKKAAKKKAVRKKAKKKNSEAEKEVDTWK